MDGPSFLHLPHHESKPRTTGLTHVIDGGTPAAAVLDTLTLASDYIDVWKFGWGTAYVDPALPRKLESLKDYGVLACLGGTLMEVAWAQGVAHEYLAWARDIGIPAIEVSRGVAAMPVSDKYDLIAEAAKDFVVFSEVGRKDSMDELTEREWAEEFIGDRKAGAQWVIAEGRESGNVALYHEDGTVRPSIVSAILDGTDLGSVFFDAPRKSQQSWFIHEFGPQVNLANIALRDAISLETLRSGLRADTFGLSQQWQPI